MRVTISNQREEVEDEVLEVTGRVSVAGAEVTVRGLEARVEGRRFSRRIRLKEGPNRFTVVARRLGYRAGRRRHSVRRIVPAAAGADATQPDSGSTEAGCPAGEELLMRMGYTYCGRPGPARPEDCPEGSEPAGETGACAPVAPEPSTPEELEEQGFCDPTYIFPDGTNGCTHDYND